MIEAVQNELSTSSASVIGTLPVPGRTAPRVGEAGFERPAPSAIVSLGVGPRAPITYNAAGLIEPRLFAAREALGTPAAIPAVTTIPANDAATTAAALFAAASTPTPSASDTGAPAATTLPPTPPTAPGTSATGAAVAGIAPAPTPAVAVVPDVDLVAPQAQAIAPPSVAAAGDAGIPFIPGAPTTTDINVPAPPAVTIPPVDVTATGTLLPGAPGTTDVAAPAVATTPTLTTPTLATPTPVAATEAVRSFVPAPPGIITVAPPASAVPGAAAATTFIPTPAGAIAVAVSAPPVAVTPPAGIPESALRFIPTAEGAVAIVAPGLPITATPAAATDIGDAIITPPPVLLDFAATATADGETPPAIAANAAVQFIPAPAGAIALPSPEPAAVTLPGDGRAAPAATAPDPRIVLDVAAPVSLPRPLTTVPAAVAEDAIVAPTTPAPAAAPAARPVLTITELLAPAAPPVAAPAATAGALPGPTAPNPTGVDAATLAHNTITENPFYAGLAATLYVNAMVFRLQQASAAELPQSTESVQEVGGLRAVVPVFQNRDGPADDQRDGATLERRAIAAAIVNQSAHSVIAG